MTQISKEKQRRAGLGWGGQHPPRGKSGGFRQHWNSTTQRPGHPSGHPPIRPPARPPPGPRPHAPARCLTLGPVDASRPTEGLCSLSPQGRDSSRCPLSTGHLGWQGQCHHFSHFSGHRSAFQLTSLPATRSSLPLQRNSVVGLPLPPGPTLGSPPCPSSKALATSAVTSWPLDHVLSPHRRPCHKGQDAHSVLLATPSQGVVGHHTCPHSHPAPCSAGFPSL